MTSEHAVKFTRETLHADEKYVTTGGRAVDGNTVATCEGPCREANAMLFAAAPQLFSACQMFLDLFCESDMRPEDECHELAHEMRKAVEKAKGIRE